MINVQRFMIHLHNDNSAFSPKDAGLLLAKAQDLVADHVIVRDTRVSRKYIEFDISIGDNDNVQDILDLLESISAVAGYEQVIERHMEKEQAIRKAVWYFNEEKYWNAHEVLESIWKNSSGLEKSLLNGIILVAAAFVHDEKNEPDVAISILKRAMAKLGESREGVYHGIDIDRIKKLVNGNVDSGMVERFTI